MNINQAFAELCFETQRFVIKKAIRNSFQFQQNKNNCILKFFDLSGWKIILHLR